MGNWTVSIRQPAEGGQPYVAEVETDGTKVDYDSTGYPRSTTCDITFSASQDGSTRHDISMSEYIYDPEADPRLVTVNALLGTVVEGSDSAEIRDD